MIINKIIEKNATNWYDDFDYDAFYKEELSNGDVIFDVNNIHIKIKTIGHDRIVFFESWFNFTFESSVNKKQSFDYVCYKYEIAKNKTLNINLNIQNKAYIENHNKFIEYKNIINKRFFELCGFVVDINFYINSISFNIKNESCLIEKTLYNRFLYKTDLKLNEIVDLNIYEIAWYNIVTNHKEISEYVNQICLCMENMKRLVKYESLTLDFEKELIMFFYSGSYKSFKKHYNNRLLEVTRTSSIMYEIKLINEELNFVDCSFSVKKSSMTDKEKVSIIKKMLTNI